MFPFEKIPFSRYGSYSVVSKGKDGGVYIRDLHGGDGTPSKLYELWVEEYALEEAVVTMTPWELCFELNRDHGGKISIVMGEDSSISVFVEKATLHLRAISNRYDSVIEVAPQQWEHQFYAKNRKLKMNGYGQVEMSAKWEISESKDISFTINGREGTAHAFIRNYLVVPQARFFDDHEEIKALTKNHYEEWVSSFEKPPTGDYEGLARYILWGNVVGAGGCLHYDAMYMTKGVMNNIWSWDNCFGALALGEAHPRLAWEQIALFARWQDKSGALPDYINDMFASYSCQKPPIYGIIAVELLRRNRFFSSKEIMTEMYDLMSNMVRFWLENRSDNSFELPAYYHGNDSGWDNASVFHNGVPVCTPDLSAFLVQQMDTLSIFAKELGMLSEADSWTTKADLLYTRLVDQLYDYDRGCFVSKNLKDGGVNLEAKSLLKYLPLVISYRFSKEMTSRIVKNLHDQFECEFGLATESLDSKYYKKGGYWQGPIWAPVTYIFVWALEQGGFSSFPSRLTEKFCRLPEFGLMAENFDPQTV